MSPRVRIERRRWSPAEDALLARRYPNEPTATLAGELERTVLAVYQRSEKLGLAKSADYLASMGARCGMLVQQSGAASRFQPGHVPANKGLRRPGWAPGRMRETQFKKGVRRARAAELYKPIGTERISKDGYLERKVSDERPFQRRWRAVHLLLWEAAHGPLPPGHAVTFINGDRRDCRIENLRLISRRELMARNTVHNLPKPLAKTIQLLGALRRQIRRRSSSKGESA